MDKGIRQGARNCFVEMNEQRRRGLFGNDNKANTRFRAAVRHFLIENYGVTDAAASTHYNEAFQLVKAATPELVSGLGRPEGKNNGGRKKKVAPVAAPTLLLTYTPPVVVSTLISEGVKENTSTHTISVNPPAAPTLYTVRKASTGEVVAEDVALDVAEKLVAKAISGKKAKLVFA